MDLSTHAFFEGKIIPWSEAKINIATHGFLYGTSVFSGMRAYWNEGKKRLFVFRPYDHYRRLLNSARMMAMDNATKACNDMIEDLTLAYNKVRQAAITAELMDIVGGAEALKG